ncbi:MAG: FKBP-type peptidyl-prolyl cis-trans isomerase [Bacteroidales bacterium]
MNVKKFVFPAFLGIIALLTSCSQYPGYKKAASGLYYKYHIKSDCESFAKPGDLVSFQMRVYTPDTVFSEGEEVFERQMMDSTRYEGDLYEALGMLCEGDSASFIFSADSLSKYYGLNFDLDSASVIYIDMVMRKIYTPEMIQKENDSLIAVEMEQFELYKKGLEGFTEIQPGVYFKENVVGKGLPITDTSIISLKMSASTIDGTEFIPDDDTPPVDFRIADEHNIPFNWNQALLTMRQGGKATLVMTSPNAFGSRGFGQGLVGPYKSIRMEIEIVNVAPGMKEFEGYSIKQFLSRNEIKEKPVSNGLIYVVQTKGTGPLLKSKDHVKVHYTGFYLDMGVFDSSRQRGEPMDVVVDESDVIKGWHEALKMMRVGERARIILPSSLAYGKEGSPPIIRPYSPLVFDLEVVEKL